MARAALAPETLISNDLRQLHCSPRNFCALAGFPYGTFSVVMTERINFTPAQVERLREKLEQMKALQESVGVPIAWDQTEELANVLALRLMQRILTEQQEPTEQWDQLAQKAMDNLR